MRRALTICLAVTLLGCAGQQSFQTLSARPEGVSICAESGKYPGYRGGKIEIENVVSGAIGAFHANDMIYKIIGPMAEAEMVIFSADIKNIGSKPLAMDSNSFIIQGDDPAIVAPISQDKILLLSRGTNVAPKNILEQMGDGIVKERFSVPVNISSGQTESLMVAFPLPLPPNPRIVVSLEGHRAEVPICWGD